jgi:hypothetical protein
MGIYSHHTLDQLNTLRESLTQSLHDRLTQATMAASGDRRMQYEQQVGEIRKEILAVCAELDARTGTYSHRPIYLV